MTHAVVAARHVLAVKVAHDAVAVYTDDSRTRSKYPQMTDADWEEVVRIAKNYAPELESYPVACRVLSERLESGRQGKGST